MCEYKVDMYAQYVCVCVCVCVNVSVCVYNVMHVLQYNTCVPA